VSGKTGGGSNVTGCVVVMRPGTSVWVQSMSGTLQHMLGSIRVHLTDNAKEGNGANSKCKVNTDMLSEGLQVLNRTSCPFFNSLKSQVKTIYRCSRVQITQSEFNILLNILRFLASP